MPEYNANLWYHCNLLIFYEYLQVTNNLKVNHLIYSPMHNRATIAQRCCEMHKIPSCFTHTYFLNTYFLLVLVLWDGLLFGVFAPITCHSGHKRAECATLTTAPLKPRQPNGARDERSRSDEKRWGETREESSTRKRESGLNEWVSEWVISGNSLSERQTQMSVSDRRHTERRETGSCLRHRGGRLHSHA